MTDSLETRTPVRPSSNFAFLELHDEQLVRYGIEAERNVRSSANTCLLKLRQFAELLAQLTAAQTGHYEWGESFARLLGRLFEHGVFSQREADIFHFLRKAGNIASHSHDGREDIRQSWKALKDARRLGIWFHRTFGEDPDYRPEPFVVPPDPTIVRAAHNKDIERVRQHVLDEGRKRRSAEERAEWETRQRALWERRAIEAERQRIEIEHKLQRLQAEASAKPSAEPRSKQVGSGAAPSPRAKTSDSSGRKPSPPHRGEPANRKWTVTEIRHMVLNNDEALERAIKTLYQRRKFATGADFRLGRECYSWITEHNGLSAELRAQARLALVSRYAVELAVAANGCYDYRDLERRGLYR